MNNKKGVVELQFNFIFVVIVGVIILSFFIGVAGWYMEKTDQDIAQDALRNIETIATGAQVSSDTNSQIEVPNIEFEFSCESEGCSYEGCYSTIDFENKGVASKPWTDVEVLFAPEKLKDDFLVSWSLSWKIPFRVCDFLYITSTDVQYVLIGSNSLSNEVFSKMKENKFIDVVKQGAFGPSSINKGKRVKLVFFGSRPNINAGGPLWTYVEDNQERIDGITYISGDESAGNAEFFEFVKSSGSDGAIESLGTYGYLMMPSLIGAVYSSDYNYYRCNMQKAMLRARTVSKIYADKATSLAGTGCGSEYTSAAGIINDFSSMFDNRDSFSNPTDKVAKINQLKSANSNLLLRDCARIY